MTPSRENTIDYLNRLVFSTTWNEIKAEFNVNIRLAPIDRRFKKATAVVNHTQVSLPSKEGSYLVLYTAQLLLFGGVNIERNKWFSAQQLVDDHKCLLYFYQREGKIIPRNKVFVNRIDSTRFLIAIDSFAVKKIFKNYHDDIFMTIYRDSDIPIDITVRNWFIDPKDPIGSSVGIADHISTCLANNKDGTTILLNGRELDNDSPISTSIGDYLEVVFDANVIGSYVVNVSNNTTGYLSPSDNKYRDILHCPKALNPNNRLITYNTCTLSIRNIQTKETRYFHTTDFKSIRQITHMDFSIATDVITPFRDYVESEDVEILVRVRTHNKDNTLMHDRSYLKWLYICDDDEIVRHLRGELDSSLPFWKASYLENSGYIKMMFNPPDRPTEESLSAHIDALGYYTVASILADHTYRARITNPAARSFILDKPYILRGQKTYPKVYLRNLKLKHQDVSYFENSDKLSVTIDQSVHINADDTVSFSVIENGPPEYIKFVPNVGQTTTTVPYSDIVVYVEHTGDMVNGYNYSTSKSYQKVNPLPGTLMTYLQPDGSLEVVFGMSLYGKTLYIQNKKFTYTKLTNLDDDIFNRRGALTIPLLTQDDTGAFIPLHGFDNIEVYVNNRKLIRNVEFTCNAYDSNSGHKSFYEIFLSNMEYFSETGENYVEVIASTDARIYEEVGYIKMGKMSYDDTATLWRDGLSIACVAGKSLALPQEDGLWLIPDIPVTNGQPYTITMTFPSDIVTFLNNYTPNVDLQRMNAINVYFKRTREISGIIVIPGSHRLFSPYLAAIIKDLHTNNLQLANDPIDNRFLAQLYKYDFIKLNDPTLTRYYKQIGNEKHYLIDDQYIDTWPSYIEWVSTPSMYPIIHRLTKLILTDRLTFGDVIDD